MSWEECNGSPGHNADRQRLARRAKRRLDRDLASVIEEFVEARTPDDTDAGDAGSRAALHAQATLEPVPDVPLDADVASDLPVPLSDEPELFDSLFVPDSVFGEVSDLVSALSAPALPLPLAPAAAVLRLS